MATGKNVFYVGAGFIGGEVLDLLVKEKYNVTVMVRRKEHGEQLKAAGASYVIGDLNDTEKIAQEAAKVDIVIHTATADNLPSVQGILAGVRERAKAGKPTIYIHTSGTSVLGDDCENAYASDKVYHDATRDDVDSVPDNAPHRQIDLTIVRAQKELGDAAKFAIMIPPMIYGYNPSKGRLSIQVPTLTRFALKHGYAAHVGAGLALESNVHVLDLSRAYITLLHHLEQSPPSATASNPYFFCEATGDAEPSWRDVAAAIGEGLHAAGKIESPEPKTMPKDLYVDAFGEFTVSTAGRNTRSRAERLRQLGWAPREKGWRESLLEDELPAILKEDHSKGFAGYGGPVAS